MKTAADLLREKDAELKGLYQIQDDAWEQEDRIKRLNKQIDERIRAIEREISDLTIRWQAEIFRVWKKRKGRHE